MDIKIKKEEDKLWRNPLRENESRLSSCFAPICQVLPKLFVETFLMMKSILVLSNMRSICLIFFSFLWWDK